MKMQTLTLACAVALASLSFGATAQTTLSPKAQYAADAKAAKTRYDGDLKLCADETASNARLQCRRDAKTEYDKALTEAKARMSVASPATAAPAPAPTPVSQPSCPDCGKVVSVNVTEKQGEGSALGVIGGGVAGALLGQQVGQGAGKDLATIAGAVGGAYAGKKIEEKVRTHKVWTVHVQYGDGSRRSFEFSQDPGLFTGDKVRNSGDSIVRD
ncbi:MAG: glycine zipper 2TM domain-containing protein [Burkholderiales bacterium]|nr:glycine zipper 2TM domain-containing protein [Burkholderiales bacterium]